MCLYVGGSPMGGAEGTPYTCQARVLGKKGKTYYGFLHAAGSWPNVGAEGFAPQGTADVPSVPLLLTL